MSQSKFAQPQQHHSNKFVKKNKNGKPNPKYVDLLDVDKQIAGQNFGCFSFITPEKILKQKDAYYFEQFLKSWELSKSMDKFSQFLHFVSYKYNISLENMTKDYEEFVKDEQVELRKTEMDSDFKTFVDKNEERLENDFNIQHNFQTSVRGFKCRGLYATQQEAELRCKMLREIDPNFDIFVGPVGQWLCWDPEAYKTGRTEYMEDELNQLMMDSIHFSIFHAFIAALRVRLHFTFIASRFLRRLFFRAPNPRLDRVLAFNLCTRLRFLVDPPHPVFPLLKMGFEFNSNKIRPI